jgi:lipoprotein-anchoring transpeptidase ErfK/SrfK
VNIREGLLVVVAAVAILTLLAPASAVAGEKLPKPPDATSGPVPLPAEPPAPSPPPQQASLELKLKGEKRGKVRVGRHVRILGTLRPWRPGHQVTMTLQRGKRTIDKEVLQVTHAGHNAGQFSYKGPVLVAPGHYQATAELDGSTTLSDASARTRTFKIRYPSLHKGRRGKDVRIFNHLLDKQGYVPSRGRRYTQRTGRAVLAYRKVHKKARITRATSGIFKTLADGRGAYKLEYPGGGRHVEVSVGRQVMVLGEKGKARRTYSVSTGKRGTPTIQGHFRFYRRQPGFNNVGMYYSTYFRGGYAVHGYNSVPNYPASHGCVRTPISDARPIYNWVRIGMSIYVY